MPSSKQLLTDANRWATSQPYVALPQLRMMCASKDTMSRIKAMCVMQKQTHPKYPKSYFELAERMIPDRVNTCRWQALVTIGAYIESLPDEVWRIIDKYAHSKDEDMRSAIAVLLLEHLLELNFPKYFRLLEKPIIAGDRLLADVLSRCWAFGQSEKQQQRVKSLLADIRPPLR